MYRFSIRELLLVTLIVAMGTAWSIDHGDWSRQEKMPKHWPASVSPILVHAG